MSGKSRILVVDDDTSLLKVLSIRLRRHGYAVEAVPSGEQALTVLSAFHPQVIITDMRMDGMHGLELLDEVQRRAPAIPVILLTAHGNLPDAIDASRRGAFAYLTKPIDSASLVGHIRRALSGSSEANESRNTNR